MEGSVDFLAAEMMVIDEDDDKGSELLGSRGVSYVATKEKKEPRGREGGNLRMVAGEVELMKMSL
ncbi:hypothetical protein CDL15_Pgr011589 [Punica granatum]|nr:hypothetical protein CDL15_Pgr011589 [Punica granatum]